MTEPREREGGQVRPSDGPRQGTSREHASRTEGTNRDFDSSGESENQGHGHPREERRDD
jgi:hypothetical protein